jgi:cell division protein ZapA
MAQVTVKINGYAYTVGCEDGQEAHLQAMAGQVDARTDSIKALGGNSGESRVLVLAALLMADEIHDLRIELESLRAVAARVAKKDAKERSGDAAAKPEGELVRKISRLAVRAEQIADGLERADQA